MLADELDYVVGVDTHLIGTHWRSSRRRMVAWWRSGRCGRMRVAMRRRFASPRGMRLERASGQWRAPVITAPASLGTWAAAVRQWSRAVAARATNADCAARTTHSTRSALHAPALASETLAVPRVGRRREALRLLLVARRGAIEVRRRALVQLRSVIVTAPDRVRAELETLPERRLLERCSHFRRSSSCSVDELATKLVLRTLARRIEAATAEAEQLEREILGHVRVLAPRLLDDPGVGPIVAADVIVAWSHPGRVRSEAAFARLAGVAPPAGRNRTNS
jgi:hypothetical protein